MKKIKLRGWKADLFRLFLAPFKIVRIICNLIIQLAYDVIMEDD